MNKNYKSPSSGYKPSHGGYPDPDMYGDEPSKYDVLNAAPKTTCACGQVPICHQLKSCGNAAGPWYEE